MNPYVLVVDDNPNDLTLTSYYVEAEEAIVEKASDGFSALEKLADDSFKFQLLIIDLQMPNMNGIELIKRVRRLEKYKKIPILVTSARRESKDVILAAQVGANDYLVKPIDAQIFEEKLGAYLGKNITWAEYDVDPESELSVGFTKSFFKILKINEIGITIKSSKEFHQDETLEIGSEFFGATKILFIQTKVQSCQKEVSLNENEEFLTKLKFVGLTEEQRKVIRLNCQSIWKKHNSKENV